MLIKTSKKLLMADICITLLDICRTLMDGLIHRSIITFGHFIPLGEEPLSFSPPFQSPVCNLRAAEELRIGHILGEIHPVNATTDF